MLHLIHAMFGWLGIVTCATALLAGGCSSFDRPYPDKALFAIELGGPPQPSKGTTRSAAAAKAISRPIASMLRVRTMRIAKPFDTTSFAYKVGRSRYTTDYYNGFIAQPDQLLTDALVSWLTISGRFGAVVEEGSMADYRLTLESNATAFYGDYTDKNSPQAVMELKLFVIDDSKSASTVIFQRSYRELQPLAGNRPEELIAGWEQAYRRILTRFLSDMDTLVGRLGPADDMQASAGARAGEGVR